jgi:hypothetical protein
MGDRVERFAALDGDRAFPAAVSAEESVAQGVEARKRLRVGEVIAALAVLGLVVDERSSTST